MRRTPVLFRLGREGRFDFQLVRAAASVGQFVPTEALGERVRLCARNRRADRLFGQLDRKEIRRPTDFGVRLTPEIAVLARGRALLVLMHYFSVLCTVRIDFPHGIVV